MEETPTNAGQDEENVNSVAGLSSSDGHEDISQQAREQPSSSSPGSSGSIWEIDIFEGRSLEDGTYLKKNAVVKYLGSIVCIHTSA